MTNWVAKTVGLAAFCLAVAGCGPVPKGNMTGNVTFKGKPICTGTVTVIGSDKLPAFGGIEADGSYTVKGIASGPVRIGVLSPEPPKEVASITETRGRGESPKVKGGPIKWIPVPEKFGDPDTSGLSATIKAGPNSHNIELN